MAHGGVNAIFNGEKFNDVIKNLTRSLAEMALAGFAVASLRLAVWPHRGGHRRRRGRHLRAPAAPPALVSTAGARERSTAGRAVVQRCREYHGPAISAPDPGGREGVRGKSDAVARAPAVARAAPAGSESRRWRFKPRFTAASPFGRSAASLICSADIGGAGVTRRFRRGGRSGLIGCSGSDILKSSSSSATLRTLNVRAGAPVDRLHAFSPSHTPGRHNREAEDGVAIVELGAAVARSPRALLRSRRLWLRFFKHGAGAPYRPLRSSWSASEFPRLPPAPADRRDRLVIHLRELRGLRV